MTGTGGGDAGSRVIVGLVTGTVTAALAIVIGGGETGACCGHEMSLGEAWAWDRRGPSEVLGPWAGGNWSWPTEAGGALVLDNQSWFPADGAGLLVHVAVGCGQSP